MRSRRGAGVGCGHAKNQLSNRSAPDRGRGSGPGACRAGAPDHAIITADTPESLSVPPLPALGGTGRRAHSFPYASIPAGRPYAESGPIFVHAKACDRYDRAARISGEIFAASASFAAYNKANDMIDAVVVGEQRPGERSSRSFSKIPQTAFLQARSATRGCYTFAIARA